MILTDTARDAQSQMAQQAATLTTTTNRAGPSGQPGEAYGLLAKVTKGLCTQMTTLKLSDSGPGSQQPLSSHGNMDFVEDNVELCIAEAQQQAGKHADMK
ncbi:hypothetical protein FRC11_003246 [Ceratobasidium sp. 423]|nr:hypothetical protein FRC11_003246 [Ceratobasidium sp. 423]